MGCSQHTKSERIQSVRLPFYFGQSVFHKDFPELEFHVAGMTITEDGSWSINVSERSGGFWVFPGSQLKSPVHDEQRAMAKWMGCSVETMNLDHDRLHELLADLLDMPSLSLAIARGKRLNEEDAALASLEEDAVLHLQKYVISRAQRDQRLGFQAR